MLVNCSLSEVDVSASYLPQFKTMFAPESSQGVSTVKVEQPASKQLTGASSVLEFSDAISALQAFLQNPERTIS